MKSGMQKHRRGINLASKPSGEGCVERLESAKGWWFDLRRCAECGHIDWVGVVSSAQVIESCVVLDAGERTLRTTKALKLRSCHMSCRPRGSELGSHLHQVSERIGSHLMHDLPPMRFDCDLAYAEFAADLLIQQTRHDQLHYLLFPLSE